MNVKASFKVLMQRLYVHVHRWLRNDALHEKTSLDDEMFILGHFIILASVMIKNNTVYWIRKHGLMWNDKTGIINLSNTAGVILNHETVVNVGQEK